MKTRLISAAVALAIFIPFLIYSDTVCFSFAIMLISVVGVFEMFRCCGVHKNIALSVPYYLAAILIPYLVWFYAHQTEKTFPLSSFLLLTIVLLILWVYPCAIFSKKTLPVNDASTASLGTIYLLTALNAIIYIRQVLPAGNYIYVLVFLGAWITDSGAYFSGRAFGKHKLIPEISPKKTVEGCIGGIIFCILSFAFYGFLVEKWLSGGSLSANYPALLISAFFISIVSQIGDLAMSLLKRHYQIKDFGKIMPGHGGVLDRFDSVIAVSIILMICCAAFDTALGMQLFHEIPLP